MVLVRSYVVLYLTFCEFLLPAVLLLNSQETKREFLPVYQASFYEETFYTVTELTPQLTGD